MQGARQVASFQNLPASDSCAHGVEPLAEMCTFPFNANVDNFEMIGFAADSVKDDTAKDGTAVEHLQRALLPPRQLLELLLWRLIRGSAW